MIQKFIGSGIHKKIILTTSISKNVNYHSEGLSYAIPQPTLEFGSLCLKNALFLLPNNNEPNISTTTTTNSQTLSLSLTSNHSLGTDLQYKDFTVLFNYIYILQLYYIFLYNYFRCPAYNVNFSSYNAWIF